MNGSAVRRISFSDGMHSGFEVVGDSLVLHGKMGGALYISGRIQVGDSKIERIFIDLSTKEAECETLILTLNDQEADEFDLALLDEKINIDCKYRMFIQNHCIRRYNQTDIKFDTNPFDNVYIALKLFNNSIEVKSLNEISVVVSCDFNLNQSDNYSIIKEIMFFIERCSNKDTLINKVKNDMENLDGFDGMCEIINLIPEQKLPEFFKHYLELEQFRGTKRCIELIVKIYCDLPIKIVEWHEFSTVEEYSALVGCTDEDLAIILYASDEKSRSINYGRLEKLIGFYLSFGIKFKSILLNKCERIIKNCYLNINSRISYPKTECIGTCVLGGSAYLG